MSPKTRRRHDSESETHPEKVTVPFTSAVRLARANFATDVILCCPLLSQPGEPLPPEKSHLRLTIRSKMGR